MSLQQVSENRVFAGTHAQYTHASEKLQCDMRFAVYLPPGASREAPVPALYWLSGLTCTDENFMQKAGAMRTAARLGMALIAPDTSPRGDDVPDDPEGAFDFGLGAGFYVNATQEPWRRHYQMYDYVTQELPALVERAFPVTQVRAISGHSMGGHGALVVGLRNPGRYCSISAFSPIANPCDCPWGQKAFSHYLGDDRSTWETYDASHLLARHENEPRPPILVDQGEADGFLEAQLKPERLKEAARTSDYPLRLRLQPGYDHSYYFITSFIDEHLEFHAQQMKRQE